VIIHKLVDGVFYSSIICERDALEEVIDARTSDAIALALRFNAPIFTYKNILDKAGIFLNKNKQDLHSDEEIDDDDILSEPEVYGEEEPQNIYSKFSIQELHTILEEAIQNEDYEKAALIKAEIDRK
jgi:bifunctional DNase/RNase